MKRLYFLFVTLMIFEAFPQDADLKFKLLGDSSYSLLVKNMTYSPLHLYIREAESDSLFKEYIIEANDSLVAHELGVGEKSQLVEDFNSLYDMGYFYGDTAARHDDSYVYSFPFSKRKKYSVSQSFNGKFSHHSEASRYAIDFQLEIGEPVHAAREGRVVKVEEHYTEYGGKEFIRMANRIIVLHSDGTTGSYVHLDHNGAIVEEGEWVERGQHIGYSGFTGYTRGPHLHFVVREGRDLSVPIYFEGHEGEVLKKRKKYKRAD